MAHDNPIRHDVPMTTSTPTQQSSELRRPIDGRIIGGVAAGLGRRFSINPWWFRVVLIVLTLFGGFGLVLYAIGWLLIPEEGADDSIIGRFVSDFDTSNTTMMIGVGLIAVAALVLATSLDLFSGNLLLAAVLFVIGVLLYRGNLGGSSDPKEPEEPDEGGGDVTDDTVIEGSATALALEDPGAGGGDPPEDVYPALPPEPPPPEAKPRSILGQLTIAATLIGVGGLALLDAAGILYPGFVHYAALALGVVGAGLLVGTIFGRARWLIVIGLLLVPVLLVASVIPSWSFNGEVGDEFFRPATLAQIRQPYELAAGSLYIDLTSLDEDEIDSAVRAVDIEVQIGAGEIQIDVPRGLAVSVEASVGVGVVDLFGDERAGLGVSSSAITGSPPVLFITAEAGAGSIVVRSVAVSEG